ncbi:tRNA (guanine(26)-N(2))-dimethyltransferase [Halorarius halobius]|uniref:tRNA (guanine(26)-N(2))-dimethyltransferase n=1 Tax=Halorarius halobius TaxID=2962671 RepID=UPI0020CB7BE0|nr:tRNA (guanine(26)-N(2))-dimethyltransferase [Halorarius halobius]
MEVSEGGITLSVPERRHGASEGAGEGVFYNPEQELNRDVTVAVLDAVADGECPGIEAGSGSYLDAMAASGIRGVRAADAGWDATCVDVDEAAVELARENFERNDLPGKATRADANAHMHESYYDVVDLDPFGTPVPFLDSACNAARDLLCVTATDTAPLCGAHFESGVRKYMTTPRNTEFHAEMGVRVLLSACVRTAARYDVAATPVLTHATSHYVRTYLALDGGARAANERVDALGHVDWCRSCLWRDHERGLIADPRDACPHCGADVETAGPIWLGATHDPAFVGAVRDRVTDYMGTAKRARKLLDRLGVELDEPTHYDQHRLYEQWSEPATAMDEFLDALRAAGHEASRTHYGGTTFKTAASVAEIRAAAP